MPVPGARPWRSKAAGTTTSRAISATAASCSTFRASAQVDVDAGRALVRAQPGIRAAEFCERLKSQGLAFPLAHSANVPIGGYLLGGGMGWNGESWGRMACFRVRALDVVTAAGERLTIDERSHPDLYWAARGAGPAFCAVATRFHLEAFPYPRGMRAAAHAFPIESSASVARWLHPLAARRIPDLELTMALETDSGAKQCTAAIACFAASEAEAARRCRPCRAPPRRTSKRPQTAAGPSPSMTSTPRA